MSISDLYLIAYFKKVATVGVFLLNYSGCVNRKEDKRQIEADISYSKQVVFFLS